MTKAIDDEQAGRHELPDDAPAATLAQRYRLLPEHADAAFPGHRPEHAADGGRRTATAVISDTPSTDTPGPTTPDPAVADADTDEPDPRRWLALAICLVGGFMTLLDVSIVNVALPSIQTGLKASQDQLQWIISGYALTFGLLLVPAGRLGDARGRRFMFMLALILFTASSALCGAAQSSTWLVAARLMQGLAGGLLTPQISALIQQLFQGRERGKAFGIFGSVIGVSTAIGPVLGGVLIQAFGRNEGWRWVFYVNLPIGLIALPLAMKFLPAPSKEQREGKHDFDPVGVVLLGVGVVLLLLPFVQEQQWRAAPSGCSCRWRWPCWAHSFGGNGSTASAVTSRWST